MKAFWASSGRSWPGLSARQVRVAIQAFVAGRSDLAWAQSLPAHRPLGNQNRARREIYLALSRLRQSMNGLTHVEPTPDDKSPLSLTRQPELAPITARRRQHPARATETTRRRQQ